MPEPDSFEILSIDGYAYPPDLRERRLCKDRVQSFKFAQTGLYAEAILGRIGLEGERYILNVVLLRDDSKNSARRIYFVSQMDVKRPFKGLKGSLEFQRMNRREVWCQLLTECCIPT